MLESIKNLPHSGEVFALSASLIWAFAIILFRISGRTVHPLGLNFFKVIVAIPLLTVTILFLGQPLFPALPWNDYGLMLLSGIIGIGFADTLLFACLNRLGAGLSAIVNCTYSPFVILLSVVFLNEKMRGWQFFGVLLIISAILTISRKKPGMHIPRKDLLTGIALGIISMFSMAVGIMIMKPILNHSPVLWALLTRSAGGVLYLGFVILAHSQRHKIWKATFSIQNWKAMLPGSFLGGYVSFMAWTAGMKYTQASVASALNQMSTVFVFLLGVILLKEKATKGKLIALLLGLIGAFLVTFY